jgi:hypothetical protein
MMSVGGRALVVACHVPSPRICIISVYCFSQTSLQIVVPTGPCSREKQCLTSLS